MQSCLVCAFYNRGCQENHFSCESQIGRMIGLVFWTKKEIPS